MEGVPQSGKRLQGENVQKRLPLEDDPLALTIKRHAQLVKHIQSAQHGCDLVKGPGNAGCNRGLSDPQPDSLKDIRDDASACSHEVIE